MPNSYLKGQVIRCSAAFKDNSMGAYVDPAVVIFRELDPSHNAASHSYGVDPDVVKVSTGQYYYDLLLDEAGEWHYRWECSGIYQGAAEARVTACSPAWPTW
jgi:hypothetical protein